MRTDAYFVRHWEALVKAIRGVTYRIEIFCANCEETYEKHVDGKCLYDAATYDPVVIKDFIIAKLEREMPEHLARFASIPPTVQFDWIDAMTYWRDERHYKYPWLPFLCNFALGMRNEP